MEESEKAEAKAESEGLAGLRFVGEGAIVQVQFFEGVAEIMVVIGVGRIEAGEDHGFHGLVAGQRFCGGVGGEGDGVADVKVLHALEAGGDIADFAGGQPRSLYGGRCEDSDFDWVDAFVAGHCIQGCRRRNGAVHHPDVGDDTLVGIVVAVEDQGLQLFAGVSQRRRYLVHDLLKDLLNVDTVLGADAEDVGGGYGQQVFDIAGNFIGHGGRQVDLVEDGDDGQVELHGGQKVGDGLGLDAL